MDDIPGPDGNFPISSSGFNWSAQPLIVASGVKYSSLSDLFHFQFCALKKLNFENFCFCVDSFV